MTEDRDMVEDANDPALSGLFKIGHAPGAVLQLSAHCRPKDRATIAIPTPRNVECTRQYGWGEGPTEFAHNMASFGLASKRPSGLQYGSRRRRGYDVNISRGGARRRRGYDVSISRGGRGDAAAPTWILRGEAAATPRLRRGYYEGRSRSSQPIFHFVATASDASVASSAPLAARLEPHR